MTGNGARQRLPRGPAARRTRGALTVLLALAALAGPAWAAEPAPAVPRAQADAPLPEPKEDSSGTLQQVRESAIRTSRIVEEVFQGQSVTLGLGYGVGNFSRQLDDQFPDASSKVVVLSDSGSVLPFFSYNSPEHLFAKQRYPGGGFLGVGGVAFGMNLVVNVATFRADRELAAKSEFQTGQIVGGSTQSRVSGTYAMAAPVIFLRLGPLFRPAYEAYFRMGYGAGLALTQFQGDLRYHRAGFPEDRERINHSPDGFDQVGADLFELRVGRWVALVNAFGIAGRERRGTYHVGYLALNLGYTFTF